jgi:hypothetical protein
VARARDRGGVAGDISCAVVAVVPLGLRSVGPPARGGRWRDAGKHRARQRPSELLQNFTL